MKIAARYQMATNKAPSLMHAIVYAKAASEPDNIPEIVPAQASRVGMPLRNPVLVIVPEFATVPALRRTATAVRLAVIRPPLRLLSNPPSYR